MYVIRLGRHPEQETKACAITFLKQLQQALPLPDGCDLQIKNMQVVLCYEDGNLSHDITQILKDCMPQHWTLQSKARLGNYYSVGRLAHDLQFDPGSHRSAEPVMVSINGQPYPITQLTTVAKSPITLTVDTSDPAK